MSAPVSLALGLFLAVILEAVGRRAKPIFRSIFFAPFLTSLVGISFVWADMFGTQNGIINYVVGLVGIPKIPWLTNPDLARVSVSMIMIWQTSGFNMIIFMAGLQSIDQTYYDAAVVDGAGSLKVFWNITLPLLSPATFFLLVIAAINGFRLFDSVFVLTSGGPGYATTTMVYFVYQEAFHAFDAGSASAMSIILVIITSITTGALWRIQRRAVHYEAR
jgi:multiple sugar transport system permease protein